MQSNPTYDVIVIGAGSGGCVVTRRLLDSGQKVLLLEAGPPDNSPFIHMPATFVRVIGTERTWVYQTTAQKHANGRTLYVPQGKTLGGGSSGQCHGLHPWATPGLRRLGAPRLHRLGLEQRAAMVLQGRVQPAVVRPAARHRQAFAVSETRHRHPLSEAFIKAAQGKRPALQPGLQCERARGRGLLPDHHPPWRPRQHGRGVFGPCA